EGEQVVEARDAVRVRGRDVEPSRRVAERALADPTYAPLRSPERREEQVPQLAQRVAAVHGAAGSVRRERAHDRVDRLALGGGRLRREQAEIHYAITFSMRIAAALNSAVPDFGSVASMVRMFVSTRSGKWMLMNASPGRS